MQWGDLITLEYGKPIKDKESANGPIPVYGTNGQIGTSHLKPLEGRALIGGFIIRILLFLLLTQLSTPSPLVIRLI